MKEVPHLSIVDELGVGLTLSVIVPCYNERPNVAPMIAKLDAALRGIDWEVIYVDDNSPDGTAAEVRRIARLDPRVRCIRRVGRRGLASAVIEGALSSSATYVAVIDGDMQHDETRLPVMLSELRSGEFDLAVASRHVEGGNNEGLANKWRHALSDGGIWLAQRLLPVKLTDPMSGFFMLPRALFEELATHLTGQGFKILLDLVLSAPRPLRVKEVPAEFHQRTAGESKLDAQVMLQFGGLLLDKTFAGYLPLRFVSFATVGAIGVMVHLGVWVAFARSTMLGFARGADDRHAGRDDVQFRVEQRDYLRRPEVERPQAVARVAVIHGGMRRWRGGEHRHRQIAVHTRTPRGRSPGRWARSSAWCGITRCPRRWCGARDNGSAVYRP